jgi:hypothetical protein
VKRVAKKATTLTGGEGDPEEEEDDHVWDREEPLDEPEPAAEPT